MNAMWTVQRSIMAACLCRNSFRAALRSTRGFALAQRRRSASQSAGRGGGNLNLIIAAGVGVAGITSFAVSGLLPSTLYTACMRTVIIIYLCTIY